MEKIAEYTLYILGCIFFYLVLLYPPLFIYVAVIVIFLALFIAAAFRLKDIIDQKIKERREKVITLFKTKYPRSYVMLIKKNNKVLLKDLKNRIKEHSEQEWERVEKELTIEYTRRNELELKYREIQEKYPNGARLWQEKHTNSELETLVENEEEIAELESSFQKEQESIQFAKEQDVNEMVTRSIREAEIQAEKEGIILARKVFLEAERNIVESRLPETKERELKDAVENARQAIEKKYEEDGYAEDIEEIYVDYEISREFIQTNGWIYAVSKFPQKGTIVFPYRRRKVAREGHMEYPFYNQLCAWLPKRIKVVPDACLNTSSYFQPYEPDIALFVDGRKTICIDVEIDEPYTAITREPIHFVSCGDDYRDDVINRHGWIVVRFAEKQVKQYPKSCAKYLMQIICSIEPNCEIPLELEDAMSLPPMKRWTKNEALKMAADNSREKYLQCRFEHKDEIPVVLRNIEQNEQERKCEKLVRYAETSGEMKYKMAMFKDTGQYERDKFIDFIPFEHVYTFCGQKQLLPVSTLVSYFFEKFDALEQASIQERLYGIPIYESLDKWDRIGRQASEVGTFVHLQIENYFKTGTYESVYYFNDNGKIQPINIAEEMKQFKNFVVDFKIKPYRQEWPIYDTDINVAGTIDLICKNGNGNYVIYDWKRSGKVVDNMGNPKIRGYNGKTSCRGIVVPDTSYYRYCIQQNLYRYILEKNYGIRIEGMYLVVLYPENTRYFCVNVPFMDEIIGEILEKCIQEDLGYRLLDVKV